MNSTLKSMIYGAFLALPCAVSAQTFCEPFGSVGSTSTIAQASVGFSNAGFTYTGTADARNTSTSTGYAGSSGNANIFITNTVGKFFEISGINTSTLTGMSLSFGVSKNVNNSDGSSLTLSVSTDGVNYTALSFPVLPTGTGTSHWYLRTASGSIPSTANLRIRWTNSTTTTQYRVDDVCLAGNVCTANITPSGATTLCDGGSVVLTASSGTAYVWSNSATTQTISVNQSGTFNVTVTASDGCTATASGPVRVLVYPTPTVGATASAATVCPGTNATLTARTFAKDLFFSEYVEGSSNEKYIEIFNGTGVTVNLSDYVYQAYHNGTVSPTFADTLSGTLADGAVLVLQNNAAGLYGGGIPTFKVAHNGNDALALYKISTASFVDIFGVIGVDPIANWTGSGGYSTLDHTLRRKASVYSGITVNPALPGQSGFSTLVSEWDQSAIDDVSGLGSHIMDGSYAWSPSTTPSTGNPVVANVTANTVYTVNGSFSASGCSAINTVEVDVFDAVTSVIDNDAPTITLCFGPQCSNLTAVPLTGSAPFSYSWSTGSTTDVATVCPTVTTVYTVTVTDNNSCVDTETTSVEVIDACCEGTNVIVCVDSETMCVTPEEVQPILDGGGSVGPCPMARMAGPGTAASLNDVKSNMPVLKAYPNPFAESTVFEVSLAQDSNLKIEVMDYTGKRIAVLNNSKLTAGNYKFNWNGSNAYGNTVANGLYFCRISSGNNVQNIKIQKLSEK